MKALHVAKYGRFPQIIQLPIPNLKTDQLLVKMRYAPINPSDINFFQGFYGIRKTGIPIVGFQGSGIIVASQNIQSNHLVGSSVSVLANKDNGTFSTHIASSQRQLIIWPRKQEFNQENVEKLAMSWINPVSCIGLASYIPKYNFETVIVSAATSQLSKILARYIKLKHPSVKIIGFSRNQKHDNQLLKLGFDFLHRITDVYAISGLRQLPGKSLFLDCIGGQFASKMFNGLSKNSLMISYGRLSKQPLNNIDLGQLYFKNKRIQGFWMNTFLDQITESELMRVKKEVVEFHEQIFCSKVRNKYPLQNYLDAMKQSIKNTSDGKILLSL